MQGFIRYRCRVPLPFTFFAQSTWCSKVCAPSAMHRPTLRAGELGGKRQTGARGRGGYLAVRSPANVSSRPQTVLLTRSNAACKAVSVAKEGVSGPEGASAAEASAGALPIWDKTTGDLLLGDEVARKVAAQAKNVRAVLDAFQAQNWPPRIDDPIGKIDPAKAEEPQRMANMTRLNETVKSLNKDFQGMRFHADGTGTRITWERT